MKTIKEFRNAGLEISEKDLIDLVTGDASSPTTSIGNVTYAGAMPVSESWTIREFSWRENTGEKPKFKGMVEWISNVGTKHTLNTNTTWWNSKMVKWRPLLNQAIPTETPEEKEELDRIFGAASGEEEKPVYTQEMKDKGELPCVGMMVKSKIQPRYKYIYQGATSDGFSILECVDTNKLYKIDSEYLEPINSPILIDGAPYMFYLEDMELLGFYIKDRKSFFENVCNGNKICGETQATNIRPLVLGDK